MVQRSARPSAPVLRLVPRAEPSVSLDDAQILAAVAQGDESAATALHARVRPQVDRTIVRLLGRRDPEHEDLAQLSMIALVGSLSRFRGECSLDTWTGRVTAHTVFKELRRRRAQNQQIDRTREIDPAAASPVDVERSVAARGMLDRVRAHLEAMDPAKSWPVVLHDVSGYDLREIAEIMEVSVAAAQSRLVRGRAELQDRIAADPELAEMLERGGPR